MIKHTVSMKNMHYKFGNLTFFIYLCTVKIIILKIDWYMENKGYELQQEFYREDSIYFEELIEANRKGGNNG